MKKSAPLRRTARFGAQFSAALDRDQRIEQRAARMANIAEIVRAAPPAAKTTMERVLGPAQPKTQAKRNPALLEMAQRRPCLLRVPGVCYGDTSTTVACHSNARAHGKAKGRKADEQYSVWGCAACHRWLDQPIGHNGPTRSQKQARFALAHLDQVIEWRRIANDMNEPVRFRRAAQWALDMLNAEPRE